MVCAKKYRQLSAVVMVNFITYIGTRIRVTFKSGCSSQNRIVPSFCCTGGKTAMHSGGLTGFNKAASSAYKSADKEVLVSTSTEYDSTMSTKEIMKKGKKIFKRIQNLVSLICSYSNDT